MRCLAIVAACAAACLLPITTSKPAAAEVVINISKSSQRMAVLVNGSARYNWLVSTGKRGFGTPNGSYRPIRLERSWFSHKYNNAPMPHSIFFYKGYALHGTTEVSQLGNIASHGCVRLHPANAAALFALVQEQGKANTRVVISDKPITAPTVDPNELVADKGDAAGERKGARMAFARATNAEVSAARTSARRNVEPGFSW
jgi:lipoprotein-anchoring transpeptidase ErfK/SrfK